MAAAYQACRDEAAGLWEEAYQRFQEFPMNGVTVGRGPSNGEHDEHGGGEGRPQEPIWESLQYSLVKSDPVRH